MLCNLRFSTLKGVDFSLLFLICSLFSVNRGPLSLPVSQTTAEERRPGKGIMARVMDYSFILQAFDLLQWCVRAHTCTSVLGLTGEYV